MAAPTNRFKHAIAAGQQQIGIWSSFGSPVVAEILASAGFDWVLFDSEHTPVDTADLFNLLQVASGGHAQAAVRPSWNDPVLIKRALDIGAQTLLLPFIQNGKEAAAAVVACRYPPQGIRGVAGSTRASGYGATPGYLTSANSEICVLVQVETRTALDQLDAIAATEGVDGVFIGPSDLAASLGHLGNPAHADVQDAIQSSVKRLQDIGKPAGILATTVEDARRYLDWGVTFVAVGVDLAIFAGSIRARAKEFGLPR